ncbi:MAG: ABC transporter permease [Nitrospirota bacterium]|nr:ABC transporter permease [Nitrospirota bacterium]
MISVAIKMLVGDRAKYLGIVMGLTFASFLITQQMSIFTGLMTRTYGFITDAGLADIWVMDPKVQFIDDVKPLQDTQLYRVRGVDGVEWAVPLYKGMLKVRLENGNYQSTNVVGLDDATLIGGPPKMLEGNLEDLRRADAVIVDAVGARGKLAKFGPGGVRIPLKVGDTLELNDHRAIVVGLCQVSRTFQSQPVIYTTYTRAVTFAPRERKLLSFVLVKAREGEDQKVLCERIKKVTGLAAYSREDFKMMTVNYFLKYTGIPINFGMAVIMGFVIGTAIAGMIFYNFTLDNLRHFGTLKAMGATNRQLLGMIILQAIVVGGVGYGLGVGAATGFGFITKGSELAFRMPWQILAITACAITVICIFAALISIRKVMKLEPAIVFKS